MSQRQDERGYVQRMEVIVKRKKVRGGGSGWGGGVSGWMGTEN